MDRILMQINCNEEIKKRIPQYIEAFVKYYGEERREEIESKFKNLLCIGYQTPDSIERGIMNLEEKKTEELIRKVYENTSVPLEILLHKANFRYKSIMVITKLNELIESYNLGKEGRIQRFYDNGFETLNDRIGMTQEEFDELYRTKQVPEKYKTLHQLDIDAMLYMVDDSRVERDYKRQYKNAEIFLRSIVPTIKEENFDELLDNEVLKELYSKKDEFEKAYEEYLEYEDSLKDYYDEIEEIKRISDTAKEHAYREYVRENISLLPQSRIQEVEDYLNGKTTVLSYDLKQIIGSTLLSTSYLEEFNDETNELLNKKDTSSWKKEEIKKNKIKYFKTMGLNLGDNYEDYINNSDASKLIPTKEQIDAIQKSRDNCLNKYNLEYYSSLRRHKKLLEEIEQIPFVDKATPVTARMYIQEYSFITPNFIKTDNGYVAYPILSINFSDYKNNATDHLIVHELNHVMETSLGLVGEKEYESNCGWESFTEEISTTTDEDIDTLEKKPVRKYELFSEIINEIIAKEISELMHNENMYIFDDPNNSRYTNTTSYEHSTFLVSDFFKEFKDAIIKSRSNGNIQIIYDEVGKENFDALNDLFKIYREHFEGMKVYSLYESLKRNEETTQTRVYNELKEKRDAILDSMRRYRDNKSVNKETYEGNHY